MMIQHHRDGIEMARLAETKGSSSEVKSLATRIRQSQENDIRELQKHEQAAPGARQQGDHQHMMEQQARQTMQRLQSASGPELDRAFVDEMIKHHEMAIDMAEAARLQNPELKDLSRKMAARQKQELESLRKQRTGQGATR
jgi:uncharacterized protein (DUF305 family)